jgi:tetratricopeptide (TPR) repeat protein
MRRTVSRLSPKFAILIVAAATLVIWGGADAVGPRGEERPAHGPSARPGLSSLEQGKKLFAAGRNSEAIRSFTEAIRENNVAEAYKLRGRAYERLGLSANAVKDFTRYIELNKASPEGYLLRADAHNFNHDYQSALEDYTTAIKLAPSRPDGYVGRGLALTGLEKYDDAVKDYQWALRLKPDSAEILANMGRCCMLAGRQLEAVSYLEKALQLETDPTWKRKTKEWIDAMVQDTSGESPKASPAMQPSKERPSRRLW